MSFQAIASTNPLSYLGTKVATPIASVNQTRNPLPTDAKNYDIGTVWVNHTINYAFILTSKPGNAAFWLPLALNGVVSGTASTTGAVTANVITFPMGINPGAVTVSALVIGFDAALNQGASYTLAASARTTGTVATQIGVATLTTREDAGLVAATTTVVVSGNNLIIRVLGVAGQTIDWSATLLSTFAT